MTQPKHARDTERGRYYSDPLGGPDLVSVTNVIDTAVNKSMALVPWGVKVTLEYALDRWTVITDRVTADRPALTKELKAVHKDVREQAADLGDRVHAAAEARVLGTPVADDPIVNPFVAQLDVWLDSWGVDLNEHIEATEITCLHRRLGYAGTADLMIWLPTGPGGRLELWLIDYKSSATRSARSVYPENTLQLAALRYCESVLLPDDTEHPMPPIERTGVLNLRAGSHALVPMPADRAAHRAFRGALETTKWLHAAPSSYAALFAPGHEPKRRTTRKAA
ncbi:hypothetical protein EASAB2608_06263 [Streptomyces sp. EAS-AB2608]|uniref:hypothetical protein n=1 Tax=Streptomyces sp. EAS-AB2608 TaxID=2779671 RepID=UPI001BEE6AFC|nr:hypothetical protein [Streptomyces sp. EAS-AB2608]BCM70929.1 hypothetical protein EASAB2608_06263 [Streptomyces sp. EAS-AB2608]